MVAKTPTISCRRGHPVLGHCFLHHFQAEVKADKKQTGVGSALDTGHA
jgi:hypothetical protein